MLLSPSMLHFSRVDSADQAAGFDQGLGPGLVFVGIENPGAGVPDGPQIPRSIQQDQGAGGLFPFLRFRRAAQCLGFLPYQVLLRAEDLPDGLRRVRPESAEIGRAHV